MKKIFLLLLLIPNCIFADTIFLKNGGVVRHVDANIGYDYVLYFDDGNKVKFSKSIVWKIIKPNGENYYDDQGRATEKKSLKIVLFSKGWCGNCNDVRDLLNEYQVKFSEYDIEKSPDILEEYKAIDDTGLPVLLINGNQVKGFDPLKIREFLMKS